MERRLLLICLLVLGACGSSPEALDSGPDADPTTNPNSRTPGEAGQVPGADASPATTDVAPAPADGGASDSLATDAQGADGGSTDTTIASDTMPTADMKPPGPVCPRPNPCEEGAVRCPINPYAIEICEKVGAYGCTQWVEQSCGQMVCSQAEKRCVARS